MKIHRSCFVNYLNIGSPGESVTNNLPEGLGNEKGTRFLNKNIRSSEHLKRNPRILEHGILYHLR